jgi:hypothetical protein
MERKWTRAAWKTSGLLLALALAVIEVRAQSAGLQPPLAPQPKAEEVYQNIQVLNGITADQMGPTMQLFAASLGVDCEFCHVTNRALDTKQAKRTAREMIRMVFALNRTTFEGRNEVTCYTCHRGSTQPAGPAPPAAADFRGLRPGNEADTEQGQGQDEAGGPPPDQLLDNYVQALGGMDALGKIASRIQKGTVTDHAGRSFGVELYSQAPDRSLQILHTPEGDVIEAFIGEAGWGKIATALPRGNQARQNEIDAARLEDQLYLATHLKQILGGLRAGSPERVGGREAYVVHATAFERVPVQFYFDRNSGNLLRLVYYTQMAFGYNPTQIDFAEYRSADGVQVPIRWTIAKVAAHFAIQIDQLQQNVPIDEVTFSLPPRPAP